MRDKWIPGLLVAALASSLFSIFVSSWLFGLACLFWLIEAVQSRSLSLQAPPFLKAILPFFAAVGLAVLFSTNPLVSAIYLKKLLKFFYVVLIFTFLGRRQVAATFGAIVLVMAASAVLGILQFFWLREVDLVNRIDGFMGHWMTFSGQLMLGSISLAGLLLMWLNTQRRRDENGEVLPPELKLALPWTRFTRSSTLGLACGALILILCLSALLLTMTRSAIGGCALGLLILLLAFRPRWALLAILGSVIAFLLLPSDFQDRFYSSFDPKDTTNQVRMELLWTGVTMVREHPLTGVGPRMVSRVHEEYRREFEFPDWAYQHLHNNLVHVAAEMGLIGLLAWIWIWGRFAYDFIRSTRPNVQDPTAAGLALTALAALTGFLFAGLFEYNFGDSEILTLLLFLVTAPYVFFAHPFRSTQNRADRDSGDSGQLRRI